MKIGHVLSVSPIYQAVSLGTLEMTSFCKLYVIVNKKIIPHNHLIGEQQSVHFASHKHLILKDRYNWGLEIGGEIFSMHQTVKHRN